MMREESSKERLEMEKVPEYTCKEYYPKNALTRNVASTRRDPES